MAPRGTIARSLALATVLALIVGAVVLASERDASNPAVVEDGIVEVKLGAVSFEPERIEIPAGTVVRFVNAMDVEHDIVQTTPDELEAGHGHDDDKHGHDDGHGHADESHGHDVDDVSHGFHSPHLEHHGDSWEARFTEPGEYPILCTVNDHYKAGMVGEIVVVES